MFNRAMCYSDDEKAMYDRVEALLLKLIERVKDFQHTYDNWDPVWSIPFEDRKKHWNAMHVSFYRGVYYVSCWMTNAIWHDYWQWKIKLGEFCQEDENSLRDCVFPDAEVIEDALTWLDVVVPVSLRDDARYSDAIKRLSRDGIDAEVADLFVAAALASSSAETKPGEARSAAEAFLCKYLDALPKTKGLFQLNGRLPIPFGPNDFMEVDLLCETHKIAIEIDGKFHFASPENYRRDRRKDYLLQTAGYFVLRFLAEDVSEKLADVLSVINRCLENLPRRDDEGRS